MRIYGNVVMACAVVMFSSSTFADDMETTGALNASAMFERCIAEAGNSGALRDMVAKLGLHRAPDELAKLYLDGRAGQVFGEDTAAGGLALSSQDDGGCTVFADRAEPSVLRKTIEAWLNVSGLTYPAPHSETRTAGNSTLTSTDYEVAGEGRHWRIVVSTGVGGRFEAIMTAYGTPASAP